MTTEINPIQFGELTATVAGLQEGQARLESTVNGMNAKLDRLIINDAQRTGAAKVGTRWGEWTVLLLAAIISGGIALMTNFVGKDHGSANSVQQTSR